MTSVTRLTIGADVECSDGICGEISRVVVDRIGRAATHLVVEPKHRRGLGRLVPLELVDFTARQVRLSCTRAEFKRLELGEVTHPLPGNSANADYGPGHAVLWRSFRPSIGGGVALGAENLPQLVTDDKIPFGEVAIGRGDRVHAIDGDIGRVQGVLIDLDDSHVTHLLLVDEHRWGRRRDVAVPIDSVGTVEHGIRIAITKRDVHDLPSGTAIEAQAGVNQVRTSRGECATVPLQRVGESSVLGTSRRSAGPQRGFAARRHCSSRDA